MAVLKITKIWHRWLLTMAIFIVIFTGVEFFNLKFLVANELYQLEGFQ